MSTQAEGDQLESVRFDGVLRVRIPAGLKAELCKAARERGKKPSELAREIFSEYIAERQEVAQ